MTVKEAADARDNGGVDSHRTGRPMTGDLAARVLAAIEECEKNRWRVHDQECDFGSHATDLTDLAVPSAACDCPEPENIARRCVADRKLLEMHVKVVELWYQGDERGLVDVAICRTCAYGISCDHCFDRDDLPLVAWPCPPLRLIAEGYGITTEEAP